MSLHSIHEYQNEVEKIIQFGGTKKETAIRNAFYHLLNEYAKQRGLMIVTEVTLKAPSGKNVTPDGTLKDMLRQDWGYWESKDESDIIDDEIKKKFDRGYPKDNILFEDSQTAVLIQNGVEARRVSIRDTEGLHQLITAFVSFERPEVKHFRKAIEHFKDDIPKVTAAIRNLIVEQEKHNTKYINAAEAFLKLCHESINPVIQLEDVREMIIQHILTEDIFNTIFDENQFHRENNIARELENVIHTFFTGQVRRIALGSIQHYYQAINAAAAAIADHHEKQKFLKVVYETFYKSYNPKAADRLGVVYTPNEVVRFMIESTDYLLHKHFNKFLEDRNVEILDPATGTGTFITDLIDYLRKEKLEYKYKNEIHANEVAILPYYISNLNIEFTYTQKMGGYAEFENLCFVDTLDNLGFSFTGKQIDIFSPFTEENSKRIKKQNGKRIAVIIGNPPYNANQANENDNNKNRQYPQIDLRIKDTFIKNSTAQKTKVYDMYARFYRWAFDRLDNNGVIAFITNRSFIDSRTFDGFRKTILHEFDYAYIVDTKSDVRVNPKIAGTTHNIFGIQTGVAIMFLIKRLKRDNAVCKIHYIALDDFWRKDQKLEWLSQNAIKDIAFEIIRPDKDNNWLNITDNDFEKLIATISPRKESLFDFNANGVNTAKDEWVYDLSRELLDEKVNFFISTYQDFLKRKITSYDSLIKWSAGLKANFEAKRQLAFRPELVIESHYRPFVKKYYYAEKNMSDRLTQNHYDLFGKDLRQTNMVIVWNTNGNDLRVFATNLLCDWHFVGDANCIPLYKYDVDGNRLDNITAWGLNRFIKKYGKKGITKEAIFNYTYAVLHNPAFLIKYEFDLKRNFPRLPFYENFNQWVAWGEQLLNLHMNYEKVSPYVLEQLSTGDLKEPKTKLRVSKEDGRIILNENTSLSGIPPEAWSYKIGNRSGLEWVLDQYREEKSKDITIEERFNNYKFKDNIERVIDLLKKVCTVSVETVKIIDQIRQIQ